MSDSQLRRFAEWIRGGAVDDCLYDICPHEDDDECIESWLRAFNASEARRDAFESIKAKTEGLRREALR